MISRKLYGDICHNINNDLAIAIGLIMMADFKNKEAVISRLRASADYIKSIESYMFEAKNEDEILKAKSIIREIQRFENINKENFEFILNIMQRFVGE